MEHFQFFIDFTFMKNSDCVCQVHFPLRVKLPQNIFWYLSFFPS